MDSRTEAGAAGPVAPAAAAFPRQAVGASGVLGVLAVLASVAGMAAPGLYRDNLLVRSGWLGNDAVTLFIAVPCLLASTWAARGGSARARLLWLGVLDYLLYNFAFYLFGAAINPLFLVYAGLFALSTFTLVAALVSLEVNTVAAGVLGGGRPRAVAVWMALVGTLLGAFWVGMSAPVIAGGPAPAVVTAVGHPTNLIGALDLTLVVPLNLLGALWLWRGRPWGAVLAVIANVKGALYMAALAAATLTAARAGATDSVGQAGLWGLIGIGCLVSSLTLLRRSPAGSPP